MKRVIIAPDSFKGTMSAAEVCDILGATVKKYMPEAIISMIPMSDGGEGMVEAYLNFIGGEKRFAPVSGPRGELMDCPYGILPDGSAVMEMAACAGLPLMNGNLDPLHATTYGVGQLLLAAAESGCSRVLMGIGGSATNDCGIGMAAALGYRFLDENGLELEPLACNIGKVRSLVKSEKLPKLSITVACDVKNPLCGENGASAIFGPQKGLKPEQIKPLDHDINAFAGLLEKEFDISLKDVPGAGAAGGLGAGLMAFCGAKLTPGIEVLLDAAGIDELLKDAMLVITGEGRMDSQSAEGKVPMGVGLRAKKAGVPCIAVCGCIGKGAEAILDKGVNAYYASSDGSKTMAELQQSCREDLRIAAEKALEIFISK